MKRSTTSAAMRGNQNAAKGDAKRVPVNVRLSPESHDWLMRFEGSKTVTLDGILAIMRENGITDLATLRALLDEADTARKIKPE